MGENKQIWNAPVEDARRTIGAAKETLFKRMLRKIFPDQRRHERIEVPPLLGYLGTMHGSRPFEVGDVSLGGFSLTTEERWEPGTEMPVTLRRTNLAPEGHEDGFTVQATVVRWTGVNVGFSILLSEEESKAAYGNPLQVKWASTDDMQMFLARLKSPDEPMPGESDRRISKEQESSLRAAFDHGRPIYTQTAGD